MPALIQVASILAPLLAIVGGAMAHARALIAGVLLLISAAGMYYAFGFNACYHVPGGLCWRCRHPWAGRGKTGRAQGAFLSHFRRRIRSSEIGPAPLMTITRNMKVHITR